MDKERLFYLLFFIVLGISILVLFYIYPLNSPLEKENHWGEHSRCYYFNEATACGKTRFCATHVTEEFCKEVGGEWLLETPEREAIEWAYFAKTGEKTNMDRKLNLIPKEKRCFLLIIPFSTLEETETKIPDVKYFARNILKVDDEYHEKILSDYKKWKKEARHSSQA